MVPVLNSSVEYFYQGGTFTPNNDDWMASASQKDYHEHIDLEEEFQAMNSPKKHWNYFNNLICFIISQIWIYWKADYRFTQC